MKSYCINLYLMIFYLLLTCTIFAQRPKIDVEKNIESVKNLVHIQHEHSGKYIYISDSNNGHLAELWGPIIAGQENKFTFELVDLPGNKYYLKHIFSEKFLCSDKMYNGDPFWIWGPIPQGHEPRFFFYLEPAGPDKFYIKHEFSNKYLCSVKKENGENFWMWGPIPQGQERRYTFNIQKSTMSNSKPIITEVAINSGNLELGPIAYIEEGIAIIGKGFSSINANNSVGLRNRNASNVPPLAADYVGELKTTYSSPELIHAWVPGNIKEFGPMYVWVHVKDKGHSNVEKITIYQNSKSTSIAGGKSTDLIAHDWCYNISSNQGKQNITINAIIKNANQKSDWKSNKEGYYTVGATVLSVHLEKKHKLAAYPQWWLEAGATAIMEGITVPFHEDNKYMIGGWTLYHPDDPYLNNNSHNGTGYQVFTGKDFLEGGFLHQEGKKCYGKK